jgi:hypothetical protein
MNQHCNMFLNETVFVHFLITTPVNIPTTETGFMNQITQINTLNKLLITDKLTSEIHTNDEVRKAIFNRVESCKVYYQSHLAKYSIDEGEQLNRFFNYHGEQSNSPPNGKITAIVPGSEEPYLEKSQKEINRFFNYPEEEGSEEDSATAMQSYQQRYRQPRFAVTEEPRRLNRQIVVDEIISFHQETKLEQSQKRFYQAQELYEAANNDDLNDDHIGNKYF